MVFSHIYIYLCGPTEIDRLALLFYSLRSPLLICYVPILITSLNHHFFFFCYVKNPTVWIEPWREIPHENKGRWQINDPSII